MKTVITPYNRSRIIKALSETPDGYIVSIDEPKAIADEMLARLASRSTVANNAMWAALGDVSEQVNWYGRKLSPENWKHVFSASLRKQDVVPGLHGDFVVLGISTSKMTIKEMSDLIELIHAFGAEHGVKFSAPEYMADG